MTNGAALNLKTLCVKEHNQQSERQSIQQEKVFGKYMIKGLMCICYELLWVINRKVKEPDKKWAKGFE